MLLSLFLSYSALVGLCCWVSRTMLMQSCKMRCLRPSKFLTSNNSSPTRSWSLKQVMAWYLCYLCGEESKKIFNYFFCGGDCFQLVFFLCSHSHSSSWIQQCLMLLVTCLWGIAFPVYDISVLYYIACMFPKPES